MSEVFLSAMGLGLLVACAALILRQLGFGATPAVICLGLVMLLSLCAEGLGSIGREIEKIGEWSNISEYASSVLKVIGIGYVSGMSSDVCETLGEGAVARGILLLGKLEILAVALPYVSEILTMALGKL